MNKIIVIGGGAAGMMAAIAAADSVGGQQSHDKTEVILYEKNEKLGKKVFITGKGRCNVTNACEPEEFFRNVISNPKFMYSALYTFDNHRVMEFFEKAGCPLKTERGERVFPVSDHSSDIICALERKLKEKGVRVGLRTPIKALLTEENEIKGVVLDNGKVEKADAVIIATGGVSYPLTGSTGDGYSFARELGITLKEPLPALVPFTVKEDWCMSLQGLSLKNVSLTLKEGKKTLYTGFGEMLFTHFGISGPLVLTASSFYAAKAKTKELPLFLDLKPALDLEQLDRRILRDFEENKNRQFKNCLGGLFPSKLIPVMIALSGINPEKKIHDISKEERRRFAELIKQLPLTVTGTRPMKEAIITMGGVSVKEINPSTMESKKIKGLYFAGEVLDVDALTGGFNLQVAWSTGFLAGQSAAERRNENEL